MSKTCLNCETELQGSFCHHCGQKSSTHRITFSKFIQHDLLHGIFHLDKGILYTLKSLIYNPGYAAKEFIKGRRVLHYNIFAFFIIVVALKTLLDLKSDPGNVFNSDQVSAKTSDDLLNGVVHHYYKLLYLLCIPLLSVFSFIFLKRLRYNFVEHTVLNCFLLAGGFFYALVFSLFGFLTGAEFMNFYAFFVMTAYILLGYFQATRGLYPFIGYLWRAVMVLLLYLCSLVLILVIIIIVFYGGSFKGMITL